MLLKSLVLAGIAVAAPVLQNVTEALQPYGATNDTGAQQLLGQDAAEPSPTINSTYVSPSEVAYDLAPGQTDTADSSLTADYISPSNADMSNPSFNFTGIDEPQPIRGNLGEFIAAQQNVELDRQNPDTLASPTTDYGSVAQLKWPMGLSHNRLQSAGYARQQNEDVLPAATQVAGVDMRLAPFGYRELHWHSDGEWSYMLNGSARIAVVNQDGENFIDNIEQGDLWYFPAGVPHSIQALDQGCEFMLVFDSGSFSEDATNLLTEWIAHTPKEVLAKNFRVPESAFNNAPLSQKYIFPGTNPGNLQSQTVQSPQGASSQAYSFHFSQQQATQVQGGSVKIVDSSTFPVSTTIAAALVTIDVGAMRELHWHFVDEWNYAIQGQYRIGVFTPDGVRTFDYQAGDVGYVPANQGHYIENIGTEPIVLLEILRTDTFADISLGQWLALTPAQVVMETINIDQTTYDAIRAMYETKQYVVY